MLEHGGDWLIFSLSLLQKVGTFWLLFLGSPSLGIPKDADGHGYFLAG